MKPNGWVCPYLTQNWVKTTQHFTSAWGHTHHTGC